MGQSIIIMNIPHHQAINRSRRHRWSKFQIHFNGRWCCIDLSQYNILITVSSQAALGFIYFLGCEAFILLLLSAVEDIRCMCSSTSL
ncbi:hypothetical protein XELAEV_18047793mg [Xenopus laevis]|uniref:Uncharacterized protein n=1 Tax=Xenopus laevis TaxID=8355 RepID=A0A974BVB6_XENLA|nr:hypothetical protein XELAEV_18047793mg [Xenopus laevis]